MTDIWLIFSSQKEGSTLLSPKQVAPEKKQLTFQQAMPWFDATKIRRKMRPWTHYCILLFYHQCFLSKRKIVCNFPWVFFCRIHHYSSGRTTNQRCALIDHFCFCGKRKCRLSTHIVSVLFGLQRPPLVGWLNGVHEDSYREKTNKQESRHIRRRFLWLSQI